MSGPRTVDEVYAAIGAYSADQEGGVRLPPEREFAEQLGTSRSTLRAALGRLVDEGRITRVRGRTGGTFLDGAPTPEARKMERRPGVAISVPALLRQQGFQIGTRILSTGLVPIPEQASEFLPELSDQAASLVERIRLADGVTLSWEKAYFPVILFPNLLEQPLAGSLYDVLERSYGTRPETTSERIEVVPASQDAARVLEIPVGSPLISVARWTRDAEGRAVEFSNDLFRADRTRLMVESIRELNGARRAGLQVVAP